MELGVLNIIVKVIILGITTLSQKFDTACELRDHGEITLR